MTKKEENKKTEAKDKEGTETPVQQKKLKEKVEVPKNTPKNDSKVKKKQNEPKELGLISDLINELDDTTDLFLRLSRNNYFKQYMDEQSFLKLGYEVMPYIDKNEFFQKMNNKK